MKNFYISWGIFTIILAILYYFLSRETFLPAYWLTFGGFCIGRGLYEKED